MSYRLQPRTGHSSVRHIAVLLSALVVTGCVASQPASDPAAAGPSAEEVLTQHGIEATRPWRTIQQVYTSASALVVATVTKIDPPVWNSADGQNWDLEYEADPDAFDTVPIPLTWLTLVVEEVVLSDSAIDLASLTEVQILFSFSPSREFAPGPTDPPSGYQWLAEGDRRLFFLTLGRFPSPIAPGVEAWRGDQFYGIWGVDDDLAVPANLDFFASVTVASMETSDPSGVGIPLEILRLGDPELLPETILASSLPPAADQPDDPNSNDLDDPGVASSP